VGGGVDEIAAKETDAIRDQQTKSEIAAAKVAAEQKIGEKRVAAFDKAAEQNATQRADRSKERKPEPRMSHKEVILVALQQGGDKAALENIVWRLFNLPNKERDGDPVLWAIELSRAVAKYDEDILQQTCERIVRHSKCGARASARSAVKTR
jgi:hypothetical protein